MSAESILRALLDMSRIDAGGVVPRMEPVALGPFIADIAAGLRPLAEAKGLRLRVLESSAVTTSDPGLLRSVVQNLLSNAIRYTLQGGVVIGVRRRGDRALLMVADSGVGIPPALQQEVFREFTRVGEVEADGMGLGLAISRRLARLLGGDIALTSRPGQGSCFAVDLPLSGEKARPRQPRRRPPAMARHAVRSLTVLVVDDEPTVVEATCAMLAGMGHVAIGATTKAEALAARAGLDCVIADLRLGGGETGVAVIEALRQGDPALPAMIVTASSGEDIARDAPRMGVKIAPKPVDPALFERFLAAVSVRQVEA